MNKIIRIVRQYLALLVLILYAAGIEAQNQSSIPLPSFTSPEAAAFIKQVDIPFDYYHGVPNISIPLVNVNSGDIPINVSLSYHASGIKVTDEATCVGLGWNLSAGGSVVKVVRGVEDVNDFNYAKIDAIIKYSSTAPNDYRTFETSGNYCLYGSTNHNCLSHSGQLLPDKTILEAGLDYAPDYYYFNFLGFSGKFISNKEGRFVCLDGSKFKIQFIHGAYGESIWEIISPDGYKATFKEMGEVIAGKVTSRTYMLTEITSPSGHRISYEYIKRVYTSKSFSQIFERSDNLGVVNEHVDLNISSTVGTTSYYVSKISFAEGMIDFTYGDRKDLIGLNSSAPKLDTIQMINGEGYLIKKVVFDYNYFKSKYNRDFEQPDTTSNKEPIWRLKLEKVTEFGRNGSAKEPYVFSYNKTRLPSKYSYSLDYWGYYNGVWNLSLLNVPDAPSYLNLNADRTPNIDFTKACVLEQITYPTGGTTVYAYEANINEHMSKQAPGLRVGNVKKYDSEGQLAFERTYTYEGPVLINPFISQERNTSRLYAMEPTGGNGELGRKRYWHSQLVVPESGVNTSTRIGYTTVNEYYGNKLDNTGRVSYVYENLRGNYDYNFSLLTNIPILGNLGNGRLKEKSVYIGNTDFPSTKEVFDYTQSQELLWGAFQEEDYGAKNIQRAYNWFFHCFPTAIYNSKLKTHTIYKDGVSKTITYKYDSPSSNKPTEVTETSDSVVLAKTNYRYAGDFSFGGNTTNSQRHAHAVLATEKNIVEEPIEIINYRKDKVVSAQFNQYDMFEGFPLLKEVLLHKPTSNQGDYQYALVDPNQNGTFVLDSDMKADVTIERYNGGKIEHYITNNGISTVILWGYNNSYPIAKIENADYSRVENVLGVAAIEALKLSFDNIFIESKLQVLRSSLSESTVSIYSYLPLVGILSVNDPNGITASYGYDNNNRLETVTDNDNNILKRYAYNYGTYLSVLVDNLNFLRTESSQNISIKTNSIWSISAPSWIRLSKTSGTNRCNVKVTCLENNTESRSGKLIITSGDKKREILVEQAEGYLLQLTSQPIYFTGEGGSHDIDITSNMNWQVTAPSWISLSTNNGSNNGRLTISCTANYDGARQGVITVSTSKHTINVQLNQQTLDKLTVSPTEHTFTSQGGSLTVNVTSNVNWSVTESNWLTLSKTSGSNNGSFTINSSINSGSARSAVITVQGGSLSKKIYITQKAEGNFKLEKTSSLYSTGIRYNSILTNEQKQTTDAYYLLTQDFFFGQEVSLNINASSNPEPVTVSVDYDPSSTPWLDAYYEPYSKQVVFRASTPLSTGTYYAVIKVTAFDKTRYISVEYSNSSGGPV